MMWMDVRGAQRVINGDAVPTSTLKVQRGSGYWGHKSLQRVGWWVFRVSYLQSSLHSVTGKEHISKGQI